MTDIEIFEGIKNDILDIKKSIDENDINASSKKYSFLKDKLNAMTKTTRDDSSYCPNAINEILNKSFTARKNTTNLSLIGRCVADANSYVDYYIDKINNDKSI
ncbi:hypothetical protein MGA5115_02228 [Marinomonas gallaica]|uniref:Uncharacterized protein n=1 Tax=Marinomonas gallaica TaxID=1806667 RepID=A0A1C3JS93_9GAMM|nr:hypothetical protein [Marinomonas gallaica]SBT18108.1 hypothetical protein MGA5115_02228 [Marinomonas gallaica]SBT22488.1 hypothetical protein MGA5116_03110 [Marinomonas gallaica]